MGERGWGESVGWGEREGVEGRGGGRGGEGRGGEGGREGGREGGAGAKLGFPPSLLLRSGPSLPPPTLRNIKSSNVER